MPGARLLSLIARTIAWLSFAAFVAITAGLVWVLLVYPDRKPGGANKDVPIYVQPGTAVDELAEILVKRNIVAHARAFTLYLRALGADRSLRSGWVVVNRSLSVREQLPRLARGYGQAFVQVPVPEGFTQFDVAARLERYGVARRHALLSAMRDRALLGSLGIEADSAEGYLFPALYGFGLETPPERVLAKMVTTFRSRTAALFTRHASPENGSLSARLTDREIVILASIVEREARASEERATIAGVFVNRLLDPTFKPRRLQADPTVAYGCLVARERIPSCLEFDGRHITPAMVRDPENPYSTYRREGLPPGPICNPGLAALEAAVNPEPHPFLYFVAKGGGRHAFARTLDEHNRNVKPEAPSGP